MNNPPLDPVSTDSDLLARIDALIAPEQRLLPSLWLLFFDGAGCQLPVIVPVDGIPDEPEPELVGKLCWIVANVLAEEEPAGSAAVVLTRPGPAVPDQAALTWRDTLRHAADAESAPIRMICLATPEGAIALPGPASP